jgi:uncharacterized protein (DUF1800 family)
MKWNSWCVLFIALIALPAILPAQSLSVLPANQTVGVNATVQYTVTATGLSSNSVTWSAGGVVGGTATAGTITASGLYTAPATIPPQDPVTITATSTVNTAISASTYVEIMAAGPTISSVTPNPLSLGSFSVTVTGTGFVPGVMLYESFGTYVIQMTTSFVNPTTLTASGYVYGNYSSVNFYAKNPGTFFGNTLTIPLAVKYTLTVNGGTGSGSYAAGTVVSIQANTPPAGQVFKEWVGGTVANNLSPSTTFTMGAANATVTAKFGSTVPMYSLTVVGGTGTGSYAAGTVVPITAGTAPAGQVFTNWTGGAVANPTSASTTFTMGTSAVTLTANFAVPVPMYALTVSGGSGTGSYAAGAVVTIVASAPTSGNYFTGWSGATVANAALASTTLTMPAAATTVTAGFATIPVPAATSISLTTVPIGVFSFTVNGTGFMPSSQVTLGTTALTTSFVSANQLGVSGFTGQSGTLSLIVTNMGVASAPLQVQVGPANAQVNINAARHFLQQAAFGPTSTEASNVQTMGFSGWLNNQFAMAKVSNYNGLGNQGGMPRRFLSNAVNQPDQLRQRVAFALSELFTISINKVIWNSDQQVYQEMLMSDAFSNFRQILQDVTLSPGMGDFLDMANNSKANAAGTVLPNENYAREVMQLFTIGTVLLNQDGSKQLDGSGSPIPTYYQTDVATFAKVFTGWTYPSAPGVAGPFPSYINSANGPMVAVPAYHDSTAKTLLQYTPLPGPTPPMTSPMGATPQQDLANALDNLFYHPNVGPFIGKQMIQHLVKSNPSPAYISRVAAAFNNNGQGVRGDMQAVISAVLTDPEARANDVPGVTQPTDGHLQEPILFLAGLLRGLNAYVDDTNYYEQDLANMGQDIYDAPSVFNYFSPGYQAPTYPGLGAPEMQIFNTYTAVYRDNLVLGSYGAGLFASYSNPIASYGPGTTIDLTPFIALAGNPTTLVNALDLSLTCGLAPAGLKTILVNAVTAETGGPLRQVQTALYLLLSSGYYNVWN